MMSDLEVHTLLGVERAAKKREVFDTWNPVEMSDSLRHAIGTSVWQLRIWIINNVTDEWYSTSSDLYYTGVKSFYFKSKEDAVLFRLTFS